MGESVAMGENLAMGVAVIFLFVYLLLFGILIASYILQSLAFHTLARRRGIANPWLAWLPYGNYWIIGSLARDYDKKNGINRRWDKTLLTLSIVFSASYFVTYIGVIIVTMVAAMNVDSATMSEETSAMILLAVVLIFIPIMIVATALQTITFICLYKIFESTVPEKALKYFLIYLLVPFAAPICLFLCRNKGYQHPDPLAYIYSPVNKNYSYYPTNAANPVAEAGEQQIPEAEETPTEE